MSKAHAYAEKHFPPQHGKTVVITGGNSGIGYEAGLILAQKGAHVILACRNMKKGAKAKEDMLKHIPTARVDIMQLDLATLESIRAFSDALLGQHPKLDVLINNAGVMALPYAETADGFEMQIGTNHLGHFALTGLLLERLMQNDGARVVNVASLAHKRGVMNFDDLHMKRNYRKWAAYCQSKLANLLFTNELAKRIVKADANLLVCAAHPGWAATNLLRSSLAAHYAGAVFAQHQAMGALPTVYAATMADVKNGDYYGPDGPLELWGYPSNVQSIRRARKADWMTRLWEESEKMTGVAMPV